MPHEGRAFVLYEPERSADDLRAEALRVRVLAIRVADNEAADRLAIYADELENLADMVEPLV